MTTLAIRKSDKLTNKEEAALVASDILKNWQNPEYRMAFIMGLGELYGNLLEHHAAEIQHYANKAAKDHSDVVRRAIAKAYVRDVLKTEVSKAKPWMAAAGGAAGAVAMGVLSHYQQERQSHRGPGGQYSSYTSDRPEGSESQYNAQLAAALQRAYANGLLSAGTQPAVKYHVADEKGDVYDTESSSGIPIVPEGHRIVGSTSNGFAKPIQVGEHVFNVATAMGLHPEQAGVASGVAQKFKEEASKDTTWGDRVNMIGQTLDLAAEGHPGIAVSSAMAQLIGQHGPDTAKVLQPHMRRALYRYRGTEAEPGQFDKAAKRQPDEDLQSFHRRLALNLYRKLPTGREIELMVQSGQMPPSRGYLLNREGKVVSEAAGEHDDHYLPFNLKHLGALNGGSYVRSRSFGGPTTEDLHVGLVTGVDRQTIVSRSGVYEIKYAHRTQRKQEGRTKSRLGYRELGGTFRDHGFGDPTKVMTKRYARLLDAIDSGKVSDPDGEMVVDDTNMPKYLKIQNPNGAWVANEARMGPQVNKWREENKRARPLKLDGHGYEVALKSLAKQYPYYIKGVDYHPANPKMGGPGGGKLSRPDNEDLGYVRPFFLKPTTTVADWHDERLRPAGLAEPRHFDEIEGYAWGLGKKYGARFNQTSNASPAPRTTGNGGVNTGQTQATAQARTTVTPAQARDARETTERGQPSPMSGVTNEVQNQNMAGGGTSHLTSEQIRHKDEVARRVRHWINNYMNGPERIKYNDLDNDDDRALYNNLADIRDLDANKKLAVNGPTDAVKNKASDAVDRANSTIEALEKDADLSQIYDSFVIEATGKPGLPMPAIHDFGETEQGNRQRANEADAKAAELADGHELHSWFNSSQGQYFTEARKNARYLGLKLKPNRNEQENREFNQLKGEWERPVKPEDKTWDLYRTPDGEPVTPNAFWNTAEVQEDDDNRESTEYHRYTNDRGEDNQTTFEAHQKVWAQLHKAKHGSEPPLLSLRNARVFNHKGEDLGRREPRPKVTAEATTLASDVAFERAVDEARLHGEKANLEQLKDEAEELDDANAERFAMQGSDPDALIGWDYITDKDREV